MSEHNKPKICSAAFVGIQAVPVTVEAHISQGLPAFHIVGLPDMAIKESRERIRSAIQNSGFSFPRTRVTVNLAPADLKKQGPAYDFPIALAILLAMGEFDASNAEKAIFLGELALDGELRRIVGALSAARMIVLSEGAFTRVFVPQENSQEALCVGEVDVYAPHTLRKAIEHLNTRETLSAEQSKPVPKVHTKQDVDFCNIKGQHHAKRGLEIAAAGGHNILLYGPPGTGKTLLARSLPSILPSLSSDEAIEVTSIASVAGVHPSDRGLIDERPFRHPHHSCSAVSLVGGGAWPKPGEVSLAHRGVLFLDELPEFSRYALEHLRQPLEDGEVIISRASATLRFPARFLLVAAMNPCPCGYASDPKQHCQCSSGTITRYRQKISGPLLDRFDMMIDVPRIESAVLLDHAQAESSLAIRERVERAREIQTQRFSSAGLLINAEIPTSKISQWCSIPKEGEQLLALAMEKHNLSARGYHRTLKLARTIADLERSEAITESHIAEALQYRPRQEIRGM